MWTVDNAHDLSLYNMRAQSRSTGETVWLESGSCLILRNDQLHDFLHFSGFDNADRATAESASGHARADHATRRANLASDFDQNIKLLATNLKVVSQGFMTLIHEIPQVRPTLAFDSVRGFQSSLDFSHYVASSSVLCRTQELAAYFVKKGLQNYEDVIHR